MEDTIHRRLSALLARTSKPEPKTRRARGMSTILEGEVTGERKVKWQDAESNEEEREKAKIVTDYETLGSRGESDGVLLQSREEFEVRKTTAQPEPKQRLAAESVPEALKYHVSWPRLAPLNAPSVIVRDWHHPEHVVDTRMLTSDAEREALQSNLKPAEGGETHGLSSLLRLPVLRAEPRPVDRIEHPLRPIERTVLEAPRPRGQDEEQMALNKARQLLRTLKLEGAMEAAATERPEKGVARRVSNESYENLDAAHLPREWGLGDYVPEKDVIDAVMRRVGRELFVRAVEGDVLDMDIVSYLCAGKRCVDRVMLDRLLQRIETVNSFESELRAKLAEATDMQALRRWDINYIMVLPSYLKTEIVPRRTPAEVSDLAFENQRGSETELAVDQSLLYNLERHSLDRGPISMTEEPCERARLLYAHTEDEDVLEAVPGSSLLGHSSHLVADDPYDEELAQSRYLKSKPACFLVIGKEGPDYKNLVDKLCAVWGCVSVDTGDVVKRELASGSMVGRWMDARLRSGALVPSVVVFELLLQRLQHNDVAHRGYVLSGLPFTGAEPSSRRQLAAVLDMAQKPDVVLYVTCPDQDALWKRRRRRLDAESGDEVSLELEGVERRVQPLFPVHGDIAAALHDLDLDLRHSKLLWSRDLVLRRRDTSAPVSADLRSYREEALPAVEWATRRLEPRRVIRLDGRTTALHMLEVVRGRLDVLRLQRSFVPVRVTQQKLQNEEKKNDSLELRDDEQDLQDDLSVQDELPLHDELEVMLEALWDNEEATTSVRTTKDAGSSDKPGLEDLHELIKANAVGNRFCWRLSQWRLFCPVALRDGRMVRGRLQHAVRFLDKLYFLSSAEAADLFIENPRSFLAPPNPIPPSRIFVMGPRLAGKTALALCLSNALDCKVVSYAALAAESLTRRRWRLLREEHPEVLTRARLRVEEDRRREHEENEEVRRLHAEEWLEDMLCLLRECVDANQPSQRSVLSVTRRTTSEVRELLGLHGVPCDVSLLRDPTLLASFLPPNLGQPAPSPRPIDEYDPDVVSYAEEELGSAMPTADVEEVALYLAQAVRDAEAERAVKTGGVSRFGGWIVDDFPPDATLFRKVATFGVVPDVIIHLRNPDLQYKNVLDEVPDLGIDTREGLNSNLLLRLLGLEVCPGSEQATDYKLQQEGSILEADIASPTSSTMDAELHGGSMNQMESKTRHMQRHVSQDFTEDVYDTMDETRSLSAVDLDDISVALESGSESTSSEISSVVNFDLKEHIEQQAVGTDANAEDLARALKRETQLYDAAFNLFKTQTIDIDAELIQIDVKEKKIMDVIQEGLDRVLGSYGLARSMWTSVPRKKSILSRLRTSHNIRDIAPGIFRMQAEVIDDKAPKGEDEEDDEEMEAEEEEGEGNERPEDSVKALVCMGETNTYCPVRLAATFSLWPGSKANAAAFSNKVYWLNDDEAKEEFLRQPWLFAKPPKALPPTRICITGPIGSGKSSVAKALSRRLGIPYVELEELIAVGGPRMGRKYEDSYDVRDSDHIMRRYLNEGVALQEQILHDLLAPLWTTRMYRCLGFVLDGFPHGDEDIVLFRKLKMAPDVILQLKVSPEETKTRVQEQYIQRWADRLKEKKIKFMQEVVAAWEERIRRMHAHVLVLLAQRLVGYEAGPDAVLNFHAVLDNFPLSFITGKAEPEHSLPLSVVQALQEEPKEPTLPSRGSLQDANRELSTHDSETLMQASELFQLESPEVMSPATSEELLLSQYHELLNLRFISDEELMEWFEQQSDKTALSTELAETVASLYPPPEVEHTWERPADAKARLEEEIQAWHAADIQALEHLREAAQELHIPWVELDARRPLEDVIHSAVVIVTPYRYRSPALLESTLDVSPSEAQLLLDCGYYFLSKFGYWCPVQVAEHSVPPHVQDHAKLWPVVYRRYVYFMAGENERKKFCEDPQKYTCLQPYMPLFPIRVAVVGPPGCGSTTLAQCLARYFGLQTVNVATAVNYVLQEMGWTQLAAQMLTVLREGHALPVKLAMKAVEAAAMGAVQAQGIVLDGMPSTVAQLQQLAKLHLTPFLILQLQSSDNKAADEHFQYSVRYLTYRRKAWDEANAPLHPWVYEQYDNLLHMDAGSTSWRLFKMAQQEVQKTTKDINAYLQHVDHGVVSLRRLCITSDEFCTRAHPNFHSFCPVCLRTGTLVAGTFAEREGLVQFRQYFYWVCDTHRDAFLQHPEQHTPPHNDACLPSDIPEPIDTLAAEDCLFEEGYCVVTYMTHKPYGRLVRGLPNLAVRYHGQVFLFCTEHCRQHFLRTPQIFADIQIHFKNTQPLPPISVAELPPMGYLEQTLCTQLQGALTHLLHVRPKYPALDAATSAALCVGLHLKVHNVNLPLDMQACYAEADSHFHDVLAIIKSTLKIMTARFNPFATPHPAPDN